MGAQGSQAYLDLGGVPDREWPSSYATEVIAQSCPRCAAEPYLVCVNPATGRDARLPCIARVSAAYAAARLHAN
jgi:hypothetical protein